MFPRVDVRLWQAGFWLLWSICTVLFLSPPSELPAIDLWDKAVHTGVFFVLMLLLLPAHGNRFPVIQLGLALVAYGVCIEVLQGFTPERSFSVLDMVADTLGVTLVLAAHRLLHTVAGRT